MGIAIDGPVETTPHSEVRALAMRARAGDKPAQLELGIRFEEGRDVVQDRRKAEKLYRLAAADGGGRAWIYSPPVARGASGQVIPFDRGAVQPGLEEASRRLAALKAANSGAESTTTERYR